MLSETINIVIGTVRFSMRCWIGRHPLPFALTVGWLRGKSDRICNQGTTIVIESYPRSANTYCVAYFRYMGNDTYKIASHQHASAQLILAKKYKKPVLVIIRRPIDAIISLKIRRQDVAIDQLVREYYLFNKSVYFMRNSIVISRFETVVHNISDVISGVNKKFGTEFKKITMDVKAKESIDSIVDTMDEEDRKHKKYSTANKQTHVGKPNKERKNNPNMEIYRQEILQSKNYQKASDIYRLLFECSDV